jgi:N-acyl-D-amino-acid deacylase
MDDPKSRTPESPAGAARTDQQAASIAMTTRREVVGAGAVGLAALAGVPAVWTRRDDFDVVVRGGVVHDGTGSPGRNADVGMRAGRIAAIAPKITERGRRELDALGMVVSPGFVDIHSHGEGNLWDDPRGESLVRQGVTTIVSGQDGSSRAWGAPARGVVKEDTGSFADWFSALDALHPAVNVAAMIGLGTVRGQVVGEDDRAATPAELARMVELVSRALDEGACGASTGLEYTPGAFARQDELIALSRPLASRGLPYATHMRNEDDELLAAIDESIAVANGARCPLQISHLKTQGPRNWPHLDDAFARIAAAKQAGLDVAFDRYPYIAYQTGLTNLFPVWSRDGGTPGFLRRLDDPATAARIRTEALGKVELIGGWDNVLIASVRAPEDRAAEGKRLGTYAKSLGAEPYALALDLLKRNNLNVGMVGFAMSEENLDRILAHPLGMVCSDGGSFAIDGPTRRGSPHPRGLGSFPRVLARYVRERKALTLEQAIHKMSAFPASRVGLTDRGRLAVGLAADVVVFDADTVADTATYEQPFQYPVGIKAVLVNGTVALHDGTREGDGKGTSLKPSRG